MSQLVAHVFSGSPSTLRDALRRSLSPLIFPLNMTAPRSAFVRNGYSDIPATGGTKAVAVFMRQPVICGTDTRESVYAPSAIDLLTDPGDTSWLLKTARPVSLF